MTVDELKKELSQMGVKLKGNIAKAKLIDEYVKNMIVRYLYI
jgi:hypothetical protein